MIIPDAMHAILALNKSAKQGYVPSSTLELAHLRASQINGCSSCVHTGSRQAKMAGETDERLFAVAAWRDAPYFTDAERPPCHSRPDTPALRTPRIGGNFGRSEHRRCRESRVWSA